MIALQRTEPLAQTPEILPAPRADAQEVRLPDLGARNPPRQVAEEISRPSQLGIRAKTGRDWESGHTKNLELSSMQKASEAFMRDCEARELSAASISKYKLLTRSKLGY